jgi:hypothetical protein
MAKDKVPGVRPYHQPAGGWGALKAVAGTLTDQETVIEGGKTLMRANQPEGFDCPGCAWPDPKHTSSFEFCENGAKAVSWEATAKRATPEFFAQHTVSELLGLAGSRARGPEGRLTHPMAYDPATTNTADQWEDALARIGAGYGPCPIRTWRSSTPRAALERGSVPLSAVRARIRHQQFPRLLEHVPRGDQRRPAGVDRRRQGHGDAGGFRPRRPVFCARAQSRHQSSAHDDHLRECAERGAPIVAFNPLRERGLETFTSPQHPVEMLTLSSTQISSTYYQVKVGGDIALC